MMTDDFKAKLTEFRKEIDTLDDEIFALIKKRFDVVEKVGVLKSSAPQTQTSFIKAGREAFLLEKANKYNLAHAPKGTAISLMRQFIASACNMEQQLKVVYLSEGKHSDYYWLGREYFGSYSQFTRQANTQRVIAEVTGKADHIGIISTPDESKDKWWTALASNETAPRVFAKLPCFISAKISISDPSAFAIGNVELEDSGNNITMMVIKTAEGTSTAKLHSIISKINLPATMVDHVASARGSDQQYLFELDGFFNADSPIIQTLKNELGEQLIILSIIGSYANQIRLEND